MSQAAGLPRQEGKDPEEQGVTMLKWLLRNRIDAFERKLGYDMSYARDMLEADPRAVLAFSGVRKMGAYRRDVPREAYWAAALTGTISEDCGPCSQLLVTLALADGVAPAVLTSVLAGDPAAMTEPVALAVRFARAVLAHAPLADELREQLVTRWGPRALVSLAFAIAGSRIYPTVKYALGHGKACQRLTVAGQVVAVGASARPAGGREAHAV
jgi:hypothetical protein